VLALAAPDPAPVSTPTPTAASPGAARALIQEGTRKHDQGDYDGAIERYRKALEIEPDNVTALYEIGYSYYAKKDLANALDYATRAAARPSPLKAAVLTLIGNIQDDRKEPARAIEAYEQAIQLDPRIPLLHFNLGITYAGLGQTTKARKAFEAGIEVNPNHASSHYALGRMYAQEGYRVPAILAFARFLVLEPATRRSTDVLQRLDAIYGAGAKRDEKGNAQITIDPDAKKDEGDFVALDLLVAMSQVGDDVIAKEGGVPPRPLEVRRLADVLTAAGELANEIPATGFAARHYIPYYAGMANQKHGDSFAYYAVQAGGSEAVARWLKVNRHAVERMLEWSQAFRWTPVPEAQPPAESP
jgi:tetratricopeptide (TPR) repeat protein